jgi:hypothetical protein
VGGGKTRQTFSEYDNEAGTGMKTALEIEQEAPAKSRKKAFEESASNVIKFNEAEKIEN